MNQDEFTQPLHDLEAALLRMRRHLENNPDGLKKSLEESIGIVQFLEDNNYQCKGSREKYSAYRGTTPATL